MGTLAELKARILDEIPEDRRVSTRQIGQHIGRAIEHHANERFWFNTQRAHVAHQLTTTPGDRVVTLTNGLRTLDAAFIDLGSTVYPLQKRNIVELDELSLNTSALGQPTDFAQSQGLITLYPAPDAAYAVLFAGVFDEPALSSDTSSNAWTTEAAELIAARAKKTLFRDLLGDGERAAGAAIAEEEALWRLRSESRARLNLGLLQPAP